MTVDTRLGAQRALDALAAEPALELRDVAVALGGKPIFSSLEMTVRRGQFLAVLGPNGAGKSTLMRAILGLVPLSAGSAKVLGQPPVRARTRIGYLPQRRVATSNVRVRGCDLVQLGIDGNRYGIPLALTPRARARRRAERRRVRELIELVDAVDYASQPIGELSGGELQRLLIAQALVSEPEMLILDEPLDGLDLANQASVAALIRQIATTRGVAVLLVAHDVNPLLEYLDGVVYLAGGNAMAGAVQDVITSSSLSQLYGTPIEVVRTRDGRLVVVGQPEAPHHHGARHPPALP